MSSLSRCYLTKVLDFLETNVRVELVTELVTSMRDDEDIVIIIQIVQSVNQILYAGSIHRAVESLVEYQ